MRWFLAKYNFIAILMLTWYIVLRTWNGAQFFIDHKDDYTKAVQYAYDDHVHHFTILSSVFYWILIYIFLL